MPFTAGSGNPGYQYDVKMADGSFCLLQYDYATPYADRPCGTRCRISDLFLCCWRRSSSFGWAGRPHLHRAGLCCRDRLSAPARWMPSLRSSPSALTQTARVCESFSATLHSMQTMGRELTDSLQSQWRMEQQRAEQIAALTHDLKTPLSIIQQRRPAGRGCSVRRPADTGRSHPARHGPCPTISGRPAHPPVHRRHKGNLSQSHPCQWVGGNSPTRPLRTCQGAAYMNEQWQGTLCAAQCDLLGLPKTCWKRRALYARRHCHTVGYKRETGFHPACDRYRPRFHCRGPSPERGSCFIRKLPAVTQPTRALGCILHAGSRAFTQWHAAPVQHARRLCGAAPANL